MDTRKPNEPPEPLELEPTTRAEASRHLHYRTLLATDRAVKKQGTHLVIQYAGINPKRQRLTYLTRRDAKEGQRVLLMELRRAESDDEYNLLLHKFLTEIQMANTERRKMSDGTDALLHHVHDCREQRPDGGCGCVFDWAKHKLESECQCQPRITDGPAPGQVFCVHRYVDELAGEGAQA